MKTNLCTLVLAGLIASGFPSFAQLYWDSNDATPGAGGPTPSGIWDADSFWSSSANGEAATGPWSDGNTAVFAAGTDATGSYTVTVNGTVSLTGLTFEEGSVTVSGGTLDFPGGGLIQVDASLATINSAIAGAGILSQLGAGTLVLGGTSPFVGTYSMAQGILRMGASGDILPFTALSLSAAATLDLNNQNVGIGSVGGTAGNILLGNGTLTNLGTTASSTYDGTISGNGGVTKTGTNNLFLRGTANTYTGRTVILGGLLNIQADTSLGTPPPTHVPDQIVIDGGRLNLARSQIEVHAHRGIYIGPNNGVISISSGQSPTNYANITGPGSLTKSGTGNISLYSTNTFAGDFIIESGGVRFNTDLAAGLGKVLVNPTANVFLRNLDVLTPARTTTLTNELIVNPGTGFVGLEAQTRGGVPETFILGGRISGTGPMVRGTQTGANGPVAFVNDNSSWSGGLRLLRGWVVLAHKNALGTGPLVVEPATFTANNNIAILAWTPLTGVNAIANPITVNITNAAASLFAFGGTNALEFSGPAHLGTNITPTLVVTNSGGTILSGNITAGAGIGLTKAGGETLILSGVNTYSGTTTLNAGTLLVNAPGSLASPVVVNTNATLGGTGAIHGGVTVNAGGRISAGTSAGTLTLGNGLNLSAAGTNLWELAANSTANPGTDFDQIVLTGGNLALGGSSVLEIRFIGSATVPTLSDPFWQANRTWKIIALNGGSNPGNSTFAAISGTNGITAGTFSVSADAAGVYLNYSTAAPAPLPRPFLTGITGAGTPTVTVHYTNTLPGTNYVLQYATNIAAPSWIDLATNTAAGTSASQTDTTAAGAGRRFYRVYFTTP